MGAQDIDTRSDVYSLGVILYELLTGARPFETDTLRKGSFAELQRIIREVEPQRPSTRLSTGNNAESASKAAASRRTEPKGLFSLLKGDLDWIVMRCMEKDRSRRYDTANALSMELDRFLKNEPVLAGPPTLAYKTRKFVSRNKAGVLVAVAGLTLLIAGLIGTSYGLVEANRQSALAEAAAAEAQARADELNLVVEFQSEQLNAIDVEAMGDQLRASILDAAPEDARADLEAMLPDVNFTSIALGTLEANIFKQTIEAIDTQFEQQPAVRAQLLQSVASTLRSLGLLEISVDPQQRAMMIRRRELGDDHPDTLRSIINMGYLLRRQGRLDDAEPYYREALDGFRLALGDDHPETMSAINNLGVLLRHQGKLDEAEPFYRQALEGQRRALGDDHVDTLISVSNLGSLLRGQGKLDEAEQYFREALEGQQRVLGNDHRGTLISLSNIGSLLQLQGKPDEAETYFRQAMDGLRRTLGDDHPNTLISASYLVQLLIELDRSDEALALIESTIANGHRSVGADHWFMGNFNGKRGRALQRLERYEEAESAMLEGHEILAAALGASHEQTVSAIEALVTLYDEWHEAEPNAGHAESAIAWRAKAD